MLGVGWGGWIGDRVGGRVCVGEGYGSRKKRREGVGEGGEPRLTLR